MAKDQTKQTKYIFVTGGVLSSLGKGIAAASIATLLKNSGQKVSMLKADPYINVDPGTMSPLEHGEVFVTDDGAETDLDLEKFIARLSKKNARAIIWEKLFKLFLISSAKSFEESKKQETGMTF